MIMFQGSSLKKAPPMIMIAVTIYQVNMNNLISVVALIQKFMLLRLLALFIHIQQVLQSCIYRT